MQKVTLDIEKLRQLANNAGIKEIDCQENPPLISFGNDDVRYNVYHTTGKVVIQEKGKKANSGVDVGTEEEAISIMKGTALALPEQKELSLSIHAAITEGFGLPEGTDPIQALKKAVNEAKALKIEDDNDIKGYNALSEARKKIKRTRIAIQNAEKGIITSIKDKVNMVKKTAEEYYTLLTPAEEELEQREKAYEAAVEARKNAEKQAIEKRYNDRVEQLKGLGINWDGMTFRLSNKGKAVDFAPDYVKTVSEETWKVRLAGDDISALLQEIENDKKLLADQQLIESIKGMLRTLGFDVVDNEGGVFVSGFGLLSCPVRYSYMLENGIDSIKKEFEVVIREYTRQAHEALLKLVEERKVRLEQLSYEVKEHSGFKVGIFVGEKDTPLFVAFINLDSGDFEEELNKIEKDRVAHFQREIEINRQKLELQELRAQKLKADEEAAKNRRILVDERIKGLQEKLGDRVMVQGVDAADGDKVVVIKRAAGNHPNLFVFKEWDVITKLILEIEQEEKELADRLEKMNKDIDLARTRVMDLAAKGFDVWMSNTDTKPVYYTESADERWIAWYQNGAPCKIQFGGKFLEVPVLSDEQTYVGSISTIQAEYDLYIDKVKNETELEALDKSACNGIKGDIEVLAIKCLPIECKSSKGKLKLEKVRKELDNMADILKNW